MIKHEASAQLAERLKTVARLRAEAREAFYEADPGWRRARDRYWNAVAAAERAWFVLHPQADHPGVKWAAL